MWMVFTDDVTHHTSRLFVRLVPIIAQLVHGKEHATMDRLETIPDIR